MPSPLLFTVKTRSPDIELMASSIFWPTSLECSSWLASVDSIDVLVAYDVISGWLESRFGGLAGIFGLLVVLLAECGPSTPPSFFFFF